ncbi:MAG: hypothetical protein Q9162_001689 [Coniocarpon cinnabarinum]
MSGRNSTVSTSEASFGVRSGRDNGGSAKYVRRPNLAQILADEAPPPWTLEDFTAYAARNLCLENIEFIQDARRYKMAYETIVGSLGMETGTDPSLPNQSRPAIPRMNSAQMERLRELWTRLMINYIAPSSPKEINLTADIRAGLLPHNKQQMPPSPNLLEPAIKKIEQLIEESILFTFLNEKQASVSNSNYQPSVASQERLALETNFSHPMDKFSTPPSLQEFQSPLTDPVAPFSAFPPGRPSPRSSQIGSPHGMVPMGSHKGSAASAPTSMPAIGSAAASLAPTLSEDSVSPVASQHEGVTPPRTPPNNEPENKRSPKQNDRWKRMSQRLGFNRKSGTHLKDVQEHPPPLP